MGEFFLIIFFPITAILLWLVIRKLSKKPWVQTLLMTFGLTLILITLFAISSLDSSGDFQFWSALALVYLLYYIPSMLILFVFFIILRMMRDKRAPK